MVKKVGKTIGIYIAFLLQSLMLENTSIFSSTPDILLTAIIIVSIGSKCNEAVVYGAFGGLLIDFLCGRLFGVYTITYMYLALAVSFTADKRVVNSPIFAAWSCFAYTAIFEVVSSIVLSLVGRGKSIGMISTDVLVKGIFSAVFTVLFIMIVEHIKKRKQTPKEVDVS